MIEQNIGWKKIGARLELRLNWVEVALAFNLKGSEVTVRERDSGRDITGRFGQLLGGAEKWWEDGPGLLEADKLYGVLKKHHGVIF